jgi:hypothetical protein
MVGNSAICGDGSEILIKNGWFEFPPKTVDRIELLKQKEKQQ